jgi:hypothetical protein
MDAWNHFQDAQRKAIKDNFGKLCKSQCQSAGDLFLEPVRVIGHRKQAQCVDDYTSFEMEPVDWEEEEIGSDEIY